MKRVISSVTVQAFDSGMYVVSGNITKEERDNGAIVYKPGEKEFRDKDKKKNRKDALEFAAKIQAEVLETID